ncbi:MAG: hypothetical protein IKZ22_06155, partial [Kiritimatiellae bacterium]|nr:hypothetical protein [Kiritimatiellia bacterium]
KRRCVKINFHRVLLGFFENWDKLPQKKWDKGAGICGVHTCGAFGIICEINLTKQTELTNETHIGSAGGGHGLALRRLEAG